VRRPAGPPPVRVPFLCLETQVWNPS
jgi:hypothetical protein